ncbi:MAG: PIN domain-containing protein [Clostridiales Family XIII bacterium]|jgi:predicted nucleic acid-binding protein|nr:PIN domain-containing protein [Clostridiales Family XIII bacterium]
MNKLYVLDACALIAFLTNERGADLVESALIEAINGIANIRMNKLNLLEVYYGDYRAHGKEAANEMLDIVRNLPIIIISELADKVFEEAGRLKASYKMSLADAIALAETSVCSGAVLTADHHEFDIVEQNENINFQWIR